MRNIEISLKPKQDMPLTNGFRVKVYIKNKKPQKRTEIGYVINKVGLRCSIVIKKEFVELVQTLRISIDTHIVDSREKIVGLAFCK